MYLIIPADKCAFEVVHCAVVVFTVYLTMLSITKNIIKYGLQQLTSVIKSETITLAI
jgi:hypothetical protein